MVAKVDDKTSLNISISYLAQIAVVISIAVYGYANISERIDLNNREVKNIRGNQNNYIFPDIRELEEKVVKLEKEVLILQTEVEFYKKELNNKKKDG
jgi:uncharacterized small protein (DUF1192 family)